MHFDIEATFARQTIKFLLETHTLMIHPEEPFKLASGIFCPFYVNCRKLISHPEARSRISDYFAKIIQKKIGLNEVDVIAGGVTAGVPFATLVADRLQKPLVYIRRDPKEYGLHDQIEGGSIKGKRVLLIEDVINDGKSKKRFADAVRAEGGIMDHTLVIFSWANEKTSSALAKEGLTLHSLSDLDDLLAVVESLGSISPAAVQAIRSFVNDPDVWSENFQAKQKSTA